MLGKLLSRIYLSLPTSSLSICKIRDIFLLEACPPIPAVFLARESRDGEKFRGTDADSADAGGAKTPVTSGSFDEKMRNRHCKMFKFTLVLNGPLLRHSRCRCGNAIERCGAYRGVRFLWSLT
jgi:hypothetical protein